MPVASSPRSGLVVLCLSVGIAGAQPNVPEGFTIEFVSTGSICKQFVFAPSYFGGYGGQAFASRFGETIGRFDGESDPVTFAMFSNQPSHLRFWPGGTFPGGLYVTCFASPGNLQRGRVVRLDEKGVVTEFGPSDPPGFRFGGGGLAFSDLENGFGRFLYTASQSSPQGACICRMPPDGSSAAVFHLVVGDAGGYPGIVAGMAFGPGRAGFSTDLYFALHKSVPNRPGPVSGVYCVDAGGNRTPLATADTSPLITGIREIAFGPGGSFGEELFAADVAGRILRIDAAGNVTVFADNFAPNGTNPATTAIVFRGTSAAMTSAWGTGDVYIIRPICPTDLDQSGDTGLQDLAILLSHFGMTGGATPEMGDLDGDEDVDLGDLAVLLARFGTSC